MTKRKAKALSVKKWKWIVKNWNYSKNYEWNNDQMLKDIPELKDLCANCGYCEYTDNVCIDCPLYKLRNESCKSLYSLYNRWEDGVGYCLDASEEAEQLLEDIKKT